MPADPLALRPVNEDELAYFEQWTAPGIDPFNFHGYRTGRQLRGAFDKTGLVSADGGTLLVLLGEQIIGDVGWHTQPYGPPGAGHTYNIGIRLLPGHRGHGHGTRAQQVLTDYLFDTYPVNRVEAGTDVDNHAEQKALQRAGFTLEGVLRGAQWRAGAWHDMCMFSRVRDDPKPA